MGSVRARSLCATLLAGAAFVLSARAQSPERSALQIENVGLPAIEESLAISGDMRGPGSEQVLR
jgi:hypothetical protein